MEWIIGILVNGLLILGLSRLLSGIKVSGFTNALVASLLFALVNTFIKPILLFVSIPLTILTLGLFTFVINALMVLLVSKLMKGFEVKDFGWALIFSIALSIGSTVLGWFGL